MKNLVKRNSRKLLTLYTAVDRVTTVYDLCHLRFDRRSYSRVVGAKNEHWKNIEKSEIWLKKKQKKTKREIKKDIYLKYPDL